MERKGIFNNFEYYIGEYLYYCKSRRLRPKTINSYEQTLRLFERWAREQEHIESPQEITGIIMRHYINDLQERGKYSFYANDWSATINYPYRRRDYRQPISVTTINNYIRNLSVFFNWFCEYTMQRENPMKKIKQLKDERKAQEYLEDNELKALLNCFDKSYFPECRDFTIVLLILDTGMRLGECLQLKDDAVDFYDKAITIPAEITKGRKCRTVFFSSKTAKALRHWLSYRDRYIESNYLFPTKSTSEPVGVRSFETNFRRYIERSGIKKKYSPHALRNNFAKRCIMAGMDIYTLSRILGHSSVVVTERAYLDLTDRDIRHRYQAFSPIENLR